MKNLFKKIVIFGTTKGLGKAFSGYVKNMSKNVVEINRSDWIVDGSIKGLKNKIRGATLLICNHHLDLNSANILYELEEFYRQKEVVILIIGSVTSDVVKDQPNKYNIEKKTIENITVQIQLHSSLTKFILLKPGWIDSEMLKNNSRAKKANKMKPKQLVEYTMSSILRSIQADLNLKSITIDNYN